MTQNNGPLPDSGGRDKAQFTNLLDITFNQRNIVAQKIITRPNETKQLSFARYREKDRAKFIDPLCITINRGNIVAQKDIIRPNDTKKFSLPGYWHREKATFIDPL